MAKLIPISQNPQRYTQIDRDWQISASPNIPSVLLQRGQVLDNVVSTPDLKVDGVIIKVVEVVGTIEEAIVVYPTVHLYIVTALVLI